MSTNQPLKDRTEKQKSNITQSFFAGRLNHPSFKTVVGIMHIKLLYSALPPLCSPPSVEGNHQNFPFLNLHAPKLRQTGFQTGFEWLLLASLNY